MHDAIKRVPVIPRVQSAGRPGFRDYRPPKPAPIAEFAAEFLSAENPPKKMDIRIIRPKINRPILRELPVV